MQDLLPDQADLIFQWALHAVNAEGAVSIGTQSEKTVHRVLKYFINPSSDCHEVHVEGYIADVMNQDGRIFEIQTRNFGLLRKKLNAFLPQHPVTIVYPVMQKRTLCWILPQTGEVTKRRTSPKRGCWSDVLPELYRLMDTVGDPRLSVCVALMEGDEYRIADGYANDGKRGSHRYEIMPKRLCELVFLQNAADFKQQLIRIGFPVHGIFTAADAEKVLRLHRLNLSAALQTLVRLHVLNVLPEKRGNAKLYQWSDE